MAAATLRPLADLKNLQRIGAVLLIISVTLLVYWPAQFNGFVWDDTALVLRDPLIRSWRLIPESFRHFLFLDATAADFYRPLQRLSYMADYALWEFFPKGYHLTSIYTHIAAAVALFFLAERWLGKHRRAAALGVACIWAVHPLHTSAVTYIAGRADPLAAFFSFAGLALGLVSLELKKGARVAMFGAEACFLAALLSKESAAAALLVWLVVLLVRGVSRGILLQSALIAAVIVGSYSALRFSAQKIEPPRREASAAGARPLLAVCALGEYAQLLVAPITLRMERDVNRTSPQQLVSGDASRAKQLSIGAGVLVGLTGWWLWARWRRPAAAHALLAAAITYFPISNLFALNATLAEHWLYVPSAFLFLALAASFQRSASLDHAAPAALPPLLRIGAAALLVAALAWSAWLGLRTWQRQPDWVDQQTFLARTIADGGNTARMRINLGQFEAARGNDAAALDEFEAALRLDPGQPIALLGIAAQQLRLGDFAAAREALKLAEAYPHVAAEIADRRAVLRYREEGVDPAPGLKEAADLAPLNWPIRKRYLAALAQSGRAEAAVQELRVFLEEQPFRGDSWRMLGDLLSRTGDRSAAVAAFEQAARLDVHDEESRQRRRILLQAAEMQDLER